MTDRDTFAAAALTGLLAASDANSWADDLWADDLCRTAYGWADNMLRERGSHIPGAGKMVETPTNHDAAPAARGDARECAAPVTTGGKSMGAIGGEAGTDVAQSSHEEVNTSRSGVAPAIQPVTEPMPKEKRAEVSAEPDAYGLLDEGEVHYATPFRFEAESLLRRTGDTDSAIVPLYRHPQPTLTDADREAVRFCAVVLDMGDRPDCAATLRGLLERLK